MADIFFFGSLRDWRLVEIVLGRTVAEDRFVPARVTGFATYRMQGEAYPALLPAEGAVSEGMLLLSPSPEDVDRLTFFEEAEYGLAPIAVETPTGPVEARYFHATLKTPTTARTWDYAHWYSEDRDVAHHAAEELMSHYGRLPEDRIDEIWPGIMIRARQRARAGRQMPVEGPLATDFGPKDLEVAQRSRPYTGFLAVEEFDLRHRRFDGGWSDPVGRSAVVWGDAVTVLPYDPRRDRVLLIEQFRPGPLARGDRRPWCLEVVAGRIDADEAADVVARREAQEEAGLTLGRLERMAGYYPTSGLAAEYLESFVGEAELPRLGSSLHGVATENEDIRALVVDFLAAMEGVASGEINTGPALFSVLWLAAHRDRLRDVWQA